MPGYTKVPRNLWDNERFRGLPEDSRNLYLYLLTSPHSNSIGYFRIDDAYISADLQWDRPRLDAAWPPLLEAGFAMRDARARLVFLVDALRENQPESPNVVTKWRLMLQDLPGSPLWAHLVDSARRHLRHDWQRAWLPPPGSSGEGDAGGTPQEAGPTAPEVPETLPDAVGQGLGQGSHQSFGEGLGQGSPKAMSIPVTRNPEPGARSPEPVTHSPSTGDFVPRAPIQERGEAPTKRTRRAKTLQATASPGPAAAHGGSPGASSRGGPGPGQLKLFQVEAGVFLDEVEQQEGMRLPRESLMPVVRKAMGLLGADDRVNRGEVARQWYRWARGHDPYGRRVEPATLLRRMADKLPYWAKKRAQGQADGGFDEDARKLARWGARRVGAKPSGEDAPAPGSQP